MGPIQTLDELLGLLWRRRLLIAAVAVAMSVVTLIYAMSRPRVYQAFAVIQVESPTITDASGAVLPSSSAQRIQTIQQRLTTRESLLAVVDRHGLFQGLPLSRDQQVVALRGSVSFQPVASASGGAYGGVQQVSALIISAQADTGDRAARIANDFAQGVLDASVQNQATRARDAVAFFVEEESRLSAAIDALESGIAAYRNANADSLPDLREARRQEITDIEAEIRQLDQALVELASERTRIGQGRTLRESERQQVTALAAQEDVLQRQRADLDRRRSEVLAALTRTPEVERTLGARQRDLELLQAEFQGVTRRKAEADTAQKLEERQQTERFTLLERATVPELPSTGGRRKIAMAGLVASVLAGIGAAFLMDLVRPALRTRTQFERDVGIQPVVVIPDMTRLRRPRRAPGIPARPGAAAATAPGGMLQGWLGRLSALPRPALGAGAAVILLVVAMAVA